jgi:hypothetical protein
MGRGAGIATGYYPIADDVLLPAGTVATDIVGGSGSYDGPTCVLRATGAPVCWGLNEDLQIGAGGVSLPTPFVLEPSLFASATRLAFGGNSLFVTYDNPTFGPRAAALGNNTQRQLGTGAAAGAYSIPNDLQTPSSGALSPAPVQIVGSRIASCALLANGVVTCWGSSASGFWGVPAGPPARPTVDASEVVPNVP